MGDLCILQISLSGFPLMQSLFFSSSPNSVPYSESSSHFYPGLINSGRRLWIPSRTVFPWPTLQSVVTFHQSSWIRHKPQGEQSDGIKTQSMATALPAVFAFLKNNAKHHKCFKRGSFKILIIWKCRPTAVTRKPIQEQDTLSDHTVSYGAFPHRTNMPFLPESKFSVCSRVYGFSLSAGKVGMKGRALQVTGYLALLMLQTAVNNLRSKFAFLFTFGSGLIWNLLYFINIHLL